MRRTRYLVADPDEHHEGEVDLYVVEGESGTDGAEMARRHVANDLGSEVRMIGDAEMLAGYLYRLLGRSGRVDYVTDRRGR